MPRLETWRHSPPSRVLPRASPSILAPLIDQGYDVVAITASCALMMKFEWPLILNRTIVGHQEAGAGDASISREYIVIAVKKQAWLTPARRAGRQHRRASGLPFARAEHGPQGDGDAEADPGHEGQSRC
jgi:hypothetical protein